MKPLPANPVRWLGLAALLVGTGLCTAAEAPRKIVLIAGPITGHPKDTHEYEKNVILLKHLLDTSPSLQGQVRVEAHFKGWPKNPTTLDDTATVVLISDGSDRNLQDHPLYVGDRFAQLERQIKRGCGFVQFHWSTFNPVSHHEQITEWIGGYFDYETGTGPNRWRSAITHKEWTATPVTPDHPINRGVRPFKLREEFYHHIRFRENDPRLKPIVSVGPGQSNEWTVGWAVERVDGGRGFGFTGGHYYENWWLDDFRRLILNAIVWSAKLEVPVGGVESSLGPRMKALIVTGHNHPAHDWNAVTAALLLVMEQDPRMAVHVTENIEDLAAPKIHDYDLLVLNYVNWERPGLSEAARENFLTYLRRGGGLAIVHFANGAFHPSLPGTQAADAWPEFYSKICRRVWDHKGGSGHDAFGPLRVEITEVKHPITAGLQSFETVDELYFKQAGDLAIEPLAVALSKITKQREPMAWAYEYEKARVFQTVLGHAAESVRKAGALIRRGCVWAAGREQISFDPPAELTEGALFREGSPWRPKAGQASRLSPNAQGVSATTNASSQTGQAGTPVLPSPASLVYRKLPTREETLRASVEATVANFGPVRVHQWQRSDGEALAGGDGGWLEVPAGELRRVIEAEREHEASLFMGSRRRAELLLNGRILESNLGPPGWLANQLSHINETVPFRAPLRHGTNVLSLRLNEPASFYFAFHPLSHELRSELDERLARDFPATGEARYYRIETINVPSHIVLEVGGLGFMPDGTLMICTRRGEIWAMKQDSWKLFASGLQEPLGLWPGQSGEVFIVQRSELTRVADTDNDGAADLFETINADCGVSASQHAYIYGAARDREGNFWGAISGLGAGGDGKYFGWSFKVTPTGKFVPWSCGLRSPNGWVLTLEGDFFIADNQGEYVGTSPLHHITRGAFHGHPVGLKWDPTFTGDPAKPSIEELARRRKPAAVLFPYGSMGQSLGEGRVDETGGKFGPFAGQIFIADQCKCNVMRVVLDKVDGEFQGACFPFRSGFQSGNNRMAFAPVGSLYVGQTDRGWGSIGGRSYGLQRLVWAGEVPLEIEAMKLTRTGFDLTFTKPLEATAAANVANYSVQHYYYLYRAEYGSPQMGNTPVPVKGVRLSADRRRVSLDLPELVTGKIYEVNLRNLLAADGAEVLHPIGYYTLNRLLPTVNAVRAQR
jgi:type 1 glutamine amidotransferase